MKPLLGFVLLAVAAIARGADYTVVRSFPIGGTGSYDYIRFDAASHRLFVSHQTRVDVLDANSGKIVGSIPGLNGVHGIVIAHDLGRGFITNGNDGSVSIFDPATLKVTGSFKSGGEKPDAIEYDPQTKTLVVSNGHSNNESLIEAATGKVLHLVGLSGNPESIAFDGKGRVLVDIESHSSVTQIDLASGNVLADWPISPGEGPTGLAIDTKTRRAFASCGGNQKLIVIDADSGRQVAVLGVGDDSDGDAFDPQTRHIYVANRDGTLSVISEDSADKYTTLASAATLPVAKTLALDPSTNRIFLPAAQFGPPPAPTPANPEPMGPQMPDTFAVLVVSQQK